MLFLDPVEPSFLRLRTKEEAAAYDRIAIQGPNSQKLRINLSKT